MAKAKKKGDQLQKYYADFFLGWIPFFSLIKLFCLVWLATYETRGASRAYNSLVIPFFDAREEEIDFWLQNAGRSFYILARECRKVLVVQLRAGLVKFLELSTDDGSNTAQTENDAFIIEAPSAEVSEEEGTEVDLSSQDIMYKRRKKNAEGRR
ncbi:receptor expression-enhancing protein 3-B-like [Schistocerca gregaria]|uniref:receptor expression-enhancing protein 3-B-like n=1 Tax=Schistocerca gregaria TaxID=7010 RepID=UPI00211ECCC2|nr:receptor expression-enhancing protein 3-B-like [Schistocerca gregaria]